MTILIFVLDSGMMNLVIGLIENEKNYRLIILSCYYGNLEYYFCVLLKYFQIQILEKCI